MRTSEVYELQCWACDSQLVIGVDETCCPDCGAEFAIEWRQTDSGGLPARKKEKNN